MEYITQFFTKTKQIKYVGFEDVKYAICDTNNYLIVNTLSIMDQDCLIYGTIPYNKEETIVNEILDGIGDRCHIDTIAIILYGKNSADTSVDDKYTQLKKLGFQNVYIYAGGLFEWLLLQDVYGINEFHTTNKCKDLLKYRAHQIIRPLNLPRLTL